MKKHLDIRPSFLHVLILCTVLLLSTACARFTGEPEENGNYSLADAQARINEIARNLQCDRDDQCKVRMYRYPGCDWSELRYSNKFASESEVSDAIINLENSQDGNFQCTMIQMLPNVEGKCQASVCAYTLRPGF